MAEVTTLDNVIILLYLGGVFAVGMASTCRPNRGTSAGYFLAGRDMIWFMVGASLFASNIGSYHFIGLSGSGAAAGWGAGAYELNALYFLQLLGWVFLPVYIAGGVYTMPEYLKKRFGRERLRVYYSILSLLLYIFTKISVDLYSGVIFIRETLNWNIYASILFLLLLTAVYTVLGGLAAVIWTDTVNFIIMMIGGVILMIVAFIEVGGLVGVLEDYPCAVPNETLYLNDTCGIPREDSFRMFRHPVGSDMPFFGFILGQSPASIWYWCADQVIVQRALAAKNLSHAKGGTLLAAYFKILPTFMMVIPGMIARMLWPDEIACTSEEICQEVCGSSVGCTSIAYPRLVMELLPQGLRGLMIAVMLAALMSSLTSIFNSGATIFVVDIWKLIRKKSSEKENMIVGRLFVLVLVAVSILWLPVVANSQGGQLWHYIQEVSGYLTPPIAAVFLLAMFWHGTNEPGVFYSLMITLAMGSMRFLFMLIFPDPPCGEEDNRSWFITIHYFYVATVLFWSALFFCWIISKCTKPKIQDNMLHRLTYWTRHSKENRIDVNTLYDGSMVDIPQTDQLNEGTYTNTLSEGDFPMTVTKYEYSNGEIKTKDDINSSDNHSMSESEASIDVDMGKDCVKNVCILHASDDNKQINSEVQCDLSESLNDDDGVVLYGSTERAGKTMTQKKKTGSAAVWSVVWKYTCGITDEPEVELSEKEIQVIEGKITSIEQTSTEKMILNINLVILCIIGLIFYLLFGFIIDVIWKEHGEIDCPYYYQ